MSQFACAADGARIKGSASTAYCSVINDSFSSRSQKRFCRDHAVAYHMLLQDLAILVWIDDVSQLDGQDVPRNCLHCDQFGTYTLYADLFIRGEPSRAFRARFCDSHVDPVCQTLQIAL